MPLDRSKYRNPPPPPGYVRQGKPTLKLKDGLIKIDGVICQFILPMLEMDVFNLEGDFTKFVINSDSEDEVLEVPVEPKQPPLIDLEEDEEELAPVSEVPVQPEIDHEVEEGELPSVQASPVKESEQVIERRKSPPVKEAEQVIEKRKLLPVKKAEKAIERRKSPPVTEAEQVTERRKSPPVKKKHSPKKVSKHETSPIRKVEYIARNRSTSRGRSPKKHSKHEGSPKKRSRSYKQGNEGYSSDNSAHSGYSRRSPIEEGRRRSYSRSPSRSQDVKSNIKLDPGDHNLFGRYHCQDCNATMNSLATYETHLSGKRHLKNLKLKNVAETVQKTLQQPIQVESKYPPPPPGVYRVRSGKTSKIQRIVEDSLSKPCPGLENVIEIQGINETTYYCELCSAPCSTATIISHLTGHRHLMRCLKHFDPVNYERIQHKQKFEVEKYLERRLEDIEKDVGRGRIVVEEECEKRGAYGSSFPKSERIRREDMPGPSHRDPDDSFPEHYSSTTIPDTSMSDYYCRICDSHMNNMSMWDMHIRGKRHLSNVKKAPGQRPSKTKSVLLPNARAKIMDEIDSVTEPIVGLSKMREVQNPDAPGELYNCFLCGACLARRDVVEHLLTTKHKKKYLEDINHPEMATLKEMYMLDSTLYSIITEICGRVEEEIGRGVMEVHMVKNNLSSGRVW